MKVLLLGTGTPAPSLKRQSSGYLVEIGRHAIIFDHGPGAHHRLIESGRSAAVVTHVFFSHLHYDHCMDYPRLVLQRWDMGAGKIPELQVFGPPPLRRMTSQLFGPDGVFGPDIHSRVSHRASLDVYEARGGAMPRRPPAPAVRELCCGDTVEGSGWRVRVGQASHFQPHLDCYAYRLDSAEGSVCYSGDSGGVHQPLIDLAAGADVLIHMMHFRSGTEPTPEYRAAAGSHRDAAAVAARAGVRTLVATHMIRQLDEPGIRERLLAEMAAIYSGTIVWGEDLMEIPVRPSSTNQID